VNRSELFDVRDNVAFVTGAASGLGLAYAEVMAANGARVVLADKDADGLDKAVSRLRSAGLAVDRSNPSTRTPFSASSTSISRRRLIRSSSLCRI
jgi:NADP-dependent 3-hydroxy acid dehydrogenase YdfG